MFIVTELDENGLPKKHYGEPINYGSSDPQYEENPGDSLTYAKLIMYRLSGKHPGGRYAIIRRRIEYDLIEKTGPDAKGVPFQPC